MDQTRSPAGRSRGSAFVGGDHSLVDVQLVHFHVQPEPPSERIQAFEDLQAVLDDSMPVADERTDTLAAHQKPLLSQGAHRFAQRGA